MYYFKTKSRKNYTFYCLDFDNDIIYTQQTYTDYYEVSINDFIHHKKGFNLKQEYSAKVDFYTENVFDYSLSDLYYGDFLRQVVISIIRNIKISKLLE